MRIQRSNPTTRFVVIPNDTAQNHELSFTARGLLAYLVSLPDGTMENAKTLATRSREGRQAIARAMQELEDAGHLKRGAQHATGTQFRGIQLTISDVPMDGAESPKDRESGLSVDQNLKNQVQNPNQTQPPVGTGSVEMTRSEKALAGLAEIDGRLHLSAAEVVSLTPLADEWFDRGADERRFAAVLTLALPESISHPAAFLRRRLNDKMPSVRPVEAPQAAPQVRRHECPECDRPVVSEGRCAGCRVNETTSVETDTRDWRQMARQFGVGALTA